MNSLDEFAKYRGKIEWELRTIAITRDRSRPKRQRTQSREKIAKFERNMLALKSKWKQMIENVFLKISDQDIYDKMAADLTKSFLDIDTTCEFEGDQLDYALRCAVLPVAALLMSEQEDGSRACLRQSRRVYFLKKLLYGMFMVYPQMSRKSGQGPKSPSPEVIWILSQSPDSRGSNDVQIIARSQERSTQSDNRSTSYYQDAESEETMQFFQPTLISKTVLNILFEAIEKHSQNMSRYPRFARAIQSRIFQIVNIAHVVDILKTYLADVIAHLSASVTETEVTQTDKNFLCGFNDLMEEYEKKLYTSLDNIERSHKSTQFKKQVDSLLYQVKYIKARLNK